MATSRIRFRVVRRNETGCGRAQMEEDGVGSRVATVAGVRSPDRRSTRSLSAQQNSERQAELLEALRFAEIGERARAGAMWHFSIPYWAAAIVTGALPAVRLFRFIRTR